MDEHFMERALELARHGIGRVSPNPLVGCVIVKEGKIIGEGAHLIYGGPHAEPNAIADAESKGESVEGSTVYVTLEPHSHFGKTPPCSQLLIDKRIARCVIALQDPYPEVNGRGIRELRAAGIYVTVGVCETEAREQNRFFLKQVTTGHPYVTLKVAQSLDGRSALANGESHWITGEPSRQRVHAMRAEYDAVLIGTSTANIDNPRLTVRATTGRNPWRIVLDARAELDPSLNILSDDHKHRTIVVTTPACEDRARTRYGASLDIVTVEGEDRIDLMALFSALSARGIASVLIEAGPKLAASVVAGALFDEVQIFIAPIILGGDAQPSFGALGLESLGGAPRLNVYRVERIGDDVLLRLRK